MPKVFSEEDVHCLEQTIKHLAERKLVLFYG